MATKDSLDVTKASTVNKISMDPGPMTLDRLPVELLLIIAALMTDDTINTPALSGDVVYTSSEGITNSYSSFDSHAFGNSGVLEAEAYDQVVKDSQRDICSLALTNKRMFTACENAMFRTIVVYIPGLSFRWLLDIFAKKPELQRWVGHLSARDTCLGRIAQTDVTRMHRILNTDLLSCSLRSVDLQKLNILTALSSNVLKHWCLLLPKLRRLERLSMTNCGFSTEEFPYLPNVREAYFISCHFYGIPDGPHGSITGAVFPKLPSLRVLANNQTFDICPKTMLQPFENTLESLAWSCASYENPRTLAIALCRLKNLKHLQAESFMDLFERPLFGQDPCSLARTLETIEFFPHSRELVMRHPAHSRWARTGELENKLRSVERICRLVLGVRLVDFRYLFGRKERDGRPKGYGPDLAEWWGPWGAETSADLSREELQRRSGITFIYE